MTMAILAIIGSFVFGFVLCSLFAVGAAADCSDCLAADEKRRFGIVFWRHRSSQPDE